MRKATGLLLLLVLNLTSISPAIAQKTRVGRQLHQDVDARVVTTFGEIAGYSDGSGAWLTWQMLTEKSNFGFQVYRIDGSERVLVPFGDYVKGSQPLHGSEVVRGETYDFFDEKGTTETLYVIVAMTIGGGTVESAPFYPSYAADLASLSGFRERDPRSRNTSNGYITGSELVVNDKELKAEIESYDLAPDPVTHRTVISTPGSVKIGVRKDGPVRVTRTQLQNAGFNVNGDTSTWQLFTEGNEQAITIGPNADYIEFLGKGVDRLESDMRMYYLIQGIGVGKRIGLRTLLPGFSTVVAPSVPQLISKKERTFYFSRVLNGNNSNYFGTPVSSTSTANVNFTLSGIDLSSPTATITLRLQGYTLFQHEITVILNGQTLPSLTADGAVPITGNFSVPTSLLIEGTNTFQLKETVVGAFSLFDSVSVAYSRKFTALQNQLTIAAPHFKNIDLDGFTSPNIRVFDVTNENEPVLVLNLHPQATGSSFGLRIPNGRARVYWAVEDSQIGSAAFVGANDPALLTAPGMGANFVVISHPSLIPQAQAWATYRASASVTSRVVNVDEIYDEFNYGVASADAVRAFLQYATSNWAPAPQYVLLMGDGSYDPRNYENRGYFDMVPAKFVDTVYMETPSDEALADFDNDGLAEMAVGRIPARDAAYVQTMLTKTQQWEASNNTSRGALFAADLYDPTNQYDFEAMSLTIAAQLPVGMPWSTAFRSAPNAKTNLIAGLNNWPYIANYSGHGTTGLWAHSTYFAREDVPSLTVTTQPTIYTMLTCLNGYFVNPSVASDSLSEVLTQTAGKGAVVTWASTGETTPDVQIEMAKKFFQDIGTLPATARIGDLIRDAKTHVDGGTDVRLSWVLLGDPMLRMHPDPPAFAQAKTRK